MGRKAPDLIKHLMGHLGCKSPAFCVSNHFPPVNLNSVVQTSKKSKSLIVKAEVALPILQMNINVVFVKKLLQKVKSVTGVVESGSGVSKAKHDVLNKAFVEMGQKLKNTKPEGHSES